MYKRIKDLENSDNNESIENYNTDTTLDFTDYTKTIIEKSDVDDELKGKSMDLSLIHI